VTDKRFLMKLLGGKYAGIWLMGKGKKNIVFDDFSSPIVALRQSFKRRIALNERSLDAEDTSIVINAVKIA
jgi:hypothetical protein